MIQYLFRVMFILQVLINMKSYIWKLTQI